VPHPGKWKTLRLQIDLKVPPKSPITREHFARALRFTLEESRAIFDRRMAGYDNQFGPHTRPVVRWRRK
jgi:hypothetical protein